MAKYGPRIVLNLMFDMILAGLLFHWINAWPWTIGIIVVVSETLTELIFWIIARINRHKHN